MTGEDYGESYYGEEGTTNTHLPDHFNLRMLTNLDAPNNHQNNRFFTAWVKAEGGSARWNPLNTTLALAGTVNWTEPTDYNSAGVKNYKYAIVGVVAAVLTLNQRDASGNLIFATLLTNLRNGTLTAEQIVQKSDANIRLWGTNPQTILDVLKTIS